MALFLNLPWNRMLGPFIPHNLGITKIFLNLDKGSFRALADVPTSAYKRAHYWVGPVIPFNYVKEVSSPNEQSLKLREVLPNNRPPLPDVWASITVHPYQFIGEKNN